MSNVILRSVLVGFASVAAAIGIGVFVALPVVGALMLKNEASDNPPEFGWDSITFAHSHPVVFTLVPALIFAFGFLCGFLHFKQSLSRK